MRASVVRVVVVNNFLVGVPALLAIYIPLHAAGFFPVAASALPSLPAFVVELLVALVVEDTAFYWSHRLLHTPALYARIHKVGRWV